MKKSEQIQALKAYFHQELRESFNEAKFNEDIKSGKEISLDKIDEYKKREIEPQKNKDKNKDDYTSKMSNGNGLSFVASFKNGEWVGVGSNVTPYLFFLLLLFFFYLIFFFFLFYCFFFFFFIIF